MEFTLSGNALKTLARSITCLSRVGNDLSIQASPSQVEKLYDFDSRLEGKIAVITDGASGIEASAVGLFHEHSVWVVIADVQEELGRALAEKLGHQASNGHCNVSVETEVRDLVDATVAKHGQLDIMYKNARVLNRPFRGILDTSLASLDRILYINLYRAFHGARHAARDMVPRH